ncbi:unnamed protein product, partial [Meganyctiphanes norvegica]
DLCTDLFPPGSGYWYEASHSEADCPDGSLRSNVTTFFNNGNTYEVCCQLRSDPKVVWPPILFKSNDEDAAYKFMKMMDYEASGYCNTLEKADWESLKTPTRENKEDF